MFVAPVHVWLAVLMFTSLTFKLVKSMKCGIVTSLSKVSTYKSTTFSTLLSSSQVNIRESIDIMWEDLIKKQGPEFTVCGSKSRHLNS